MARTSLFGHLHELMRLALRLEREGVPTREGVARMRAASPREGRVSRRGALGAMAGMGLAPMATRSRAAPRSDGPDIAVVGAGLAGLHAASLLQQRGAKVSVFEAGERVGGRVWSLRGVFPGQVAERGGELIDTTHSRLRGLARAYGLTLESYASAKLPGDEALRFFGRHWSQEDVVDEYRAFVPAMRRDLVRLSEAPTAFAANAFDRELDRMPLASYLETRGAGTLLRAVLDVAYTIEFGREIDRQSALAFLFFAAVDRRRAFTPFGVFSDERFHIVEGNDAVPRAMAAALTEPVRFGRRLVALDTLADGRVRLAFDTAAGVRESTHDAAILTLPAPAMRRVAFGPGVELPAGQRLAIERLDYGTSTKLMVGFRGRPWWERSASNGASYSDLPAHQATWETNPSLARNGERGVLTGFFGGNLGARLDPTRTDAEAVAFLGDLEAVYPGSSGLARRDTAGRVVAHLENWSGLADFMGGYTNNQPGYFTTIEGWYGQPAGRIHFAGEHTDSFYGFQGFMEGALRSGERAADEVLRLR
jgi:monoamine oxidase